MTPKEIMAALHELVDQLEPLFGFGDGDVLPMVRVTVGAKDGKDPLVLVVGVGPVPERQQEAHDGTGKA